MKTKAELFKLLHRAMELIENGETFKPWNEVTNEVYDVLSEIEESWQETIEEFKREDWVDP